MDHNSIPPSHFLSSSSTDDIQPSSASQIVVPTSAMTSHYGYDRDRLVYELIVRQEPKQARMCGVGGKADRRPIDPPPIVQLRVIDPTIPKSSPRRRRTSSSGSAPGSPTPSTSARHEDPVSPGDDLAGYAQSYLQNPYYFMFASLAKPDDDAELHWLKDGRTRCTTGSVVSSLYHLKDPQHNNEDAGFFVFPDLSVRTEGSYRLKLSLFEVVGNNVRHCKSIYSAPFYVYTAKKFPGMEESTPLSCSLADQGIKIRIRKDIRVRKRPMQAIEQAISQHQDESDDELEEQPRSKRQSGRESKRTRLEDAGEHNTGPAPGLGPAPQQPQQHPWPPVASLDPSLGPTIPPPPGPQVIPPPPPPGQEPSGGVAMGVNVPPGVVLGGPSVYDGRGGGYHPYEAPVAHPTPQMPPPQTQQQQQPPPPAYPSQPTQHHVPPPPQHVQQQQQQQQHQPQPQQQQQQQQPYTPQQHTPQQQHQQQPTHQHMGSNHMPPPPAPPMTHHVPPPPPPQGYAPYPQQTWGPPPLPPQHQPQPVYDPHSYQYTTPAIPQQTHYAPHPSQYPQHHPGHVPPPARYDYPVSMYAQPPPPAQPYGYYDQHQAQAQSVAHQQHMQGPPQYAPVPTAPVTGSPIGSIPPLGSTHSSTPGYTDYPTYPRAPTGSPRPPYHTHVHPQPTTAYAPYPPHPQHMQHQQHPSQQRAYAPQAPPPYPYQTYNAPPNPNPEWGVHHPGFGPSSGGWDVYGAQGQQQQQQQQSMQQQQPQPHAQGVPPPASATSSGLVGAIGSPGDRIQLAPLRASSGSAGSPVLPASLSGSGSQPNVGYPVIQLRSSSRNGYGPPSSRDRDDRGSGRDGDRSKKNPLSIGSIITEDA